MCLINFVLTQEMITSAVCVCVCFTISSSKLLYHTLNKAIDFVLNVQYFQLAGSSKKVSFQSDSAFLVAMPIE